MFRQPKEPHGITLALHLFLVAVLIQPLCVVAQQDQTSPLTLSQAVQIALEQNPLIAASVAGRTLADAQLKEAHSGRRPLVQASEAITNSNNPVFVFGSLLEQGRFGTSNFAIDSLNHPDPLTNFRSGISLRLPLFDQKQTATRVAQAKIRRQQADQKTDLVEQQLRFEVVRSYFGVLLSKARLAVAEDAIRTAEADVKRSRDLFETGLTVHSDLLASEVQLAEFRQQRIQTNAEVLTAVAALNTTLGLPIDSPQVLTGKLSERDFPIESLDILKVQALQNRPDYQQAISSIELSTTQVKGTSGEWQPRVEAFATANASTRYFTNGGSADYAVGANITFNLFDAGRKARRDQALANEAIAKADAEQVANHIRFEVVRAFQQYNAARERLTVVAQVAAQAAETLRIVQDRYQAGLTTITELLRAETALVRARTDVLSARYDQYLGYASVLLSAGRLKDVSQFGD